MADPETPTAESGTTRRAFVKGCVAAAGVGTVAASAYALGAPLAIVKTSEARIIKYIGAFKASGPAPRGIGWLPIDIDADGNLVGQTEFLGQNVLEWYRYCGHEGAPGLQQDGWTGSNALRFFITEDKILQGFNPWYTSFARSNAPMTAKSFEDQPVGAGAGGNWRSDVNTTDKASIITVIVIKVPKEDVESVFKFEGIDETARAEAVRLIKKTGFVGYVSFCTHFCCVPGWKEAPAQALPRNAWDNIFCTCHMSQYDPITMKSYEFLQEHGGEAGGHE